MPGKTLYKIGAFGAILGAVITQASGMAHPVETADLFNATLHMKDIAMNNSWVWVYLGFTIGFLLLLKGLVTIAKSIEDEPAASWAKIALFMAGVSTTVGIIFFVLDGFAMKIIANSVVAAPNDLALLAAAGVMDKVGRAFYGMWTFISWGAMPFALGLAVFKSSAYKKWLGVIPMLSGLVGIITGIIILVNDFTLNLLPGFYIAVLVFNLWMITMGVMLWKKSKMM